MANIDFAPDTERPPDIAFTPDTPPVQPQESLPQPSRIPSAYIPPSVEQEVTQRFDVAHPVLGAAAQGLGDVAASIPGMVAQLPKMAYEGAQFAALPSERPRIAAEVIPQAIQQGQQMAADVQAPLGTRESFRGLANLGLMALPAIGELGGLTRSLFGRAVPEAPPVQTTSLTESVFGKAPEAPSLVPETPITDAATLSTREQPAALEALQPKEIPNASQITSPESVPVPALRQEVGGEASLRQQGETATARQEVAPAQKEKIVEAAFRTPSGDIIRTGGLHGQPEGHGLPKESEAGFMTNTGRFVGREEAGQIATGVRQPLFGEDFYNHPEVAKGGGVYSEVGREVQPTVATPQEPAPAVPQSEQPPIQTSDQPVVSRIANRFVDERVASGNLGEVAPGQGFSTRELAARGLQMSPEEVNQHISDLMNKTGDPIKQAQAVRAEEARLSQRSEEASRIAQANPNDANARIAQDNAFKDLTDFHNGPVAQLKQVFHGTGMGLQGELPVDLSTYNGIRAKWLKETGEAPPKYMESRMQKTADQVKGALDAENGAMKKLGDAIEEKVGRSKLPTPDEVADNIQSRMKVEPCIV